MHLLKESECVMELPERAFNEAAWHASDGNWTICKSFLNLSERESTSTKKMNMCIFQS